MRKGQVYFYPHTSSLKRCILLKKGITLKGSIMPKFSNREEYEQWKAERNVMRDDAIMHGVSAKRPGMVLALGIGFIVFASILFLNGLGGLVRAMIIQEIDFDNMETMMTEMPAFFGVLLYVLQNLMVLSLLLTIIAVMVLVSAIYLLKLKVWAKQALEVFSWAVLAFIFIGGFLWVDVWSETSGSSEASFSLFGAGVGIIAALINAAIPITALILLRHRTVREAFSRKVL
jgi:hypothetical protein